MPRASTYWVGAVWCVYVVVFEYPLWHSGIGASRDWTLVDRVDSMWIEGNVVLDRGDGCVRRFVSPDRIHRSVSAERNAVVSAGALVGAIGVMARAFQQRHVDILSGDV